MGFIERFLCAKPRAKQATPLSSFVHYKSAIELIFLATFYVRENFNLKRLSHLPKVTEVVGGHLGLESTLSELGARPRACLKHVVLISPSVSR